MTKRRFSPCVGICTTTALGDDICRGCQRTAEEVLHWNQMNLDQREQVWQRLAQSSTRPVQSNA